MMIESLLTKKQQQKTLDGKYMSWQDSSSYSVNSKWQEVLERSSLTENRY